jgi:hypothetical protein
MSASCLDYKWLVETGKIIEQIGVNWLQAVTKVVHRRRDSVPAISLNGLALQILSNGDLFLATSLAMQE